MVFMHNICNKETGSKVRVKRGVAIILLPTAVIALREAGSQPPITLPLESPFSGRIIGVNLFFQNFGQWVKRKRGYLKMFLASIYHSIDDTEHKAFNETLSSLINYIPKSADFFGGYDVNTNLGVMLKMNRRAIVPHGINNRNKKGRRLLGLLSANNLKIVNTFYQKGSYTTWTSFHKTRSCHMLDVMTSYLLFFKCIIDCCVTQKGVSNYHSAVQVVFLNRTIEFKSDYVERPVIDWNEIKRY